MLIITQLEGTESTTVFKLEGKLLGPWTEELARACSQSRIRPGLVRLDLSAVSFVDSVGVELLRALIREGTEIIACSNFVAEMIGEGRG